jgi:toxin ParE1/3/4
MSSYSLTQQAADDLNEIHDFIATDNVTAALRFIDRLEEKFQAIAESPEIGRTRKELAPNLRSFPVGNYVIFYRPIKAGIQVIRVLHGARDIEALFEH